MKILAILLVGAFSLGITIIPTIVICQTFSIGLEVHCEDDEWTAHGEGQNCTSDAGMYTLCASGVGIILWVILGTMASKMMDGSNPWEIFRGFFDGL